MSELRKFMKLTKVDVAKKLIYGTFTAEVVDKSGEIADYETTKSAVKDWSAEIEKASNGKSLGNIRKMHGKDAVGKVKEIVYDDVNKSIHGCVEANQQTIDEADSGILNGFSIGGSYAKKWSDPVHKGKTRFTPIIAEISVVDNPCVPEAVFTAIKDASFTVIKADGTEELRKFAPKELEPVMKLAQVWQSDDGSTHASKEEAMKKNAEILAEKATAGVRASLEAVEKTEVTKEKVLSKAMMHVAALSHIVNNLSDLAKSHEADKGEGHPITEKLKKHVRGLSDTMHAMAGDEAGDMNDDHESYKAHGVSEADEASIKQALKTGKELVKFQDSDEPLQRMTAERDALLKTISELPAQIDKKFENLTKRIKELEAQPAPDNVVLTTLIKGGDIEKLEEKTSQVVIPASVSPGDRIRFMNR